MWFCLYEIHLTERAVILVVEVLLRTTSFQELKAFRSMDRKGEKKYSGHARSR